MWPTVAPDADKLSRLVNDSLTDAGIWVDDSRVVELLVRKVYTGSVGALDVPGVKITVEEVT